MTIDIAAKAKALVDTVLAEPANDHDIDLVQRQLGRYPRGMVAVGARCVCGRPLAVITRPVLPGGIPFPTTCYLTGPEAVKAASHVEAAGVMQQYNDMLALDEELKAAYEQAHNLYLAFRHELAGRLGDSEEHIEGTSAGGMPVRQVPACPAGPVLGYGTGRQPHWRFGTGTRQRRIRSDRLPLHAGRLINR